MRLEQNGKWDSCAPGFFSGEASGASTGVFACTLSWRKHQPCGFETKACAVNWLPNLNPRPVSVHMRLIQTASKRAMHRKLEGREATQCGEGPLLVSSWTSTVPSLTEGRTYCIFPRNHSHQPLWSFSGKERWKVSEAESSTAPHPTTCLLPVHRGKPVSHMPILPTSNIWPVHTEAEGRILP